MSLPRPHSMIRTRDQWLRAVHQDTAWNKDLDAVELAASVAPPHDARQPPAFGAGVAFDAGCRVYRSLPEAGIVARSLRVGANEDDPVSVFTSPEATRLGDFAPAAGGAAGALRRPRGLAIDADDRLFIAESGAARIVVVDLWSERVLRVARMAGSDGLPVAPLDVACGRRRAFAVLDGAPWLVALEARRGPWAVPLVRPSGVPADARPRRVAVFGGGAPFVLFRDGADGGWITIPGRDEALAVPDASDIELLCDQRLIVARGPGDTFLQWQIEPDGIFFDRDFRARGYDGLGIARAPDARVAYGTDAGVRHALPARRRYSRTGRVATYRLDSGELQNEWGRIFLDACVPSGCRLRLHCATADEQPEEEPQVAWQPPANVEDEEIWQLDQTPGWLPRRLAPGDDQVVQLVHRRATGRELPWSRPPAGDAFETYEAPVIAPPGRYLWLTVELTGDSAATPQVRALRAEHSSHELMRRLPRVYSREPVLASFLRRYLATVDGVTSELDGRGDKRERLLDPRSAPEELLPWLAGFIGLALDERWPLAARRTLIAEAPDLFRVRGTVASLERMLEIYLGRRPLIVEHYRLRGLGGVLVGGTGQAAYTGALVGANLRVGGAIGVEGEAPLEGSETDAFRTYAHRFTVVIPALLASEQLATVRDTLDRHRPAHTVFDVCTVGSGMRVGRGLHVGLLSTIGRTGGWETLQLGESLLGRDAVVGRPADGARVGESPLGGGVGPEVRVG
jgi:phage tail-like protein